MNLDTLYNLFVGGCPFVAFFLGIVIRKFALPGANSPPLHQQFLLGIPISLVIISPLLPVLAATATSEKLAGFLVTIGIIMEHGMLVPETATHHLQNLLQRITKSDQGNPA
jgi:hypothetical protein